MDKNGYTVSEANKEVATIARLLVLEREKRINAERLVETERQALLQLRNALEEKPQHRKEDEGTRRKMSSVSSTYSDPSSNDDAMSLSDGKLLASVFSQLPEEAQSILREQPTGSNDEHEACAPLHLCCVCVCVCVCSSTRRVSRRVGQSNGANSVRRRPVTAAGAAGGQQGEAH